MCRPLDEIDFTARDWVPHGVAWPFTRKTLVPYYDQAAETLQIKPFFAGGPVTHEPVEPDCRLALLPFRFSPPTRLGSEYRLLLTDSRNISVFSAPQPRSCTLPRIKSSHGGSRWFDATVSGMGSRRKAMSWQPEVWRTPAFFSIRAETWLPDWEIGTI